MFKSKGNASVWVIIVLLVIAAVLLFAFSDGEGDSDTATSSDDQVQQPMSSDDEAATVEEVEAALSAGGSVQCSFANEAGATGTSYVSEGQIRVMAENEGVTTNMIFVDGDVYVWEEGVTEGISFSADSFPQYSAGAMLPARPADVTQGVASGDVSCSVADVEEEMFALPESVTFASYASSSASMGGEGMMDDQN